MDKTALISLVGLRFGGVGLVLLLAPRWFRHILSDFGKMSDNELRTIGYVLLGAATILFAQQVTKRELSDKIETLLKQRSLA